MGSYLWDFSAEIIRNNSVMTGNTDDSIATSAIPGPYGSLYVGTIKGYLIALTPYAPIAKSPWPCLKHDPQGTGREGWQ